MATVIDAPTDAGLAVQTLIDRARVAQAAIEDYSQRQVDDLIRAMVWAVCQPPVAERIARLAIDESCLGNYEGKLAKMLNKTRAALADIINDKSVGVLLEVLRGADFEALPLRQPLADAALAAVGILALITLGRSERYPLVGYAIFALSRLGTALPDKPNYFLVDVLVSLEIFQLLRKWRPTHPRPASPRGSSPRD